MKAIGYKVPGPIAADAALVDINLPRPVAAGYDIPVEVKAVSVNPVDQGPQQHAAGRWRLEGAGMGCRRLCARSAPTSRSSS